MLSNPSYASPGTIKQPHQALDDFYHQIPETAAGKMNPEILKNILRVIVTSGYPLYITFIRESRGIWSKQLQVISIPS